MQLSKKENILIVIAGILFLALFGICSYFNRFAVDDYYHIHDEKLYGIWGGMLEGYYHWGGRWTSYLLWDCIYHFHDSSFVLMLYTFSIILCFIFSVYFLLKRISELNGITENKKNLLSYSILFSAFVFLFSFGKGEIWFWVQSTAMFTVSIIAFLIGAGFVLSKGKSLFHYLMIIACFTYAGGAAEVYAIFYILMLILLIIVFFITPKNKLYENIKSLSLPKIIIAFIFLLPSFIFSITAPGNAVRASWLPEPSFVNALYITFKELGTIIIFKFIPQLPWALLFIAPFTMFGFFSGEYSKKRPLKKIFKPFLISCLILVIALYIMLYPSCYILSEAGPDRSLSLMIMTVAVFISGWAFCMGKYFISKIRILRTGNFISIAAVILLITVICINQHATLSKYSSALDKRTARLIQLQKEKNRKMIVLDPLPSSGYLYSAEISSDTAYFGNEHYRMGLFLDFKVCRKK